LQEFLSKHNEKSALSLMMRICSSQEKCKSDIAKKLADFELSKESIEEILETLEKENFINEERFAIAFAKDKFRFNKWGKVKIKHELNSKKINNSNIYTALDSIDEYEYFEMVKGILIQKIKTIKNIDSYQAKAKLINFAQSKGFEMEIIYKCLPQINFEE
jgi:regulatory protein